jgi:hypothetical protein
VAGGRDNRSQPTARSTRSIERIKVATRCAARPWESRSMRVWLQNAVLTPGRHAARAAFSEATVIPGSSEKPLRLWRRRFACAPAKLCSPEARSPSYEVYRQNTYMYITHARPAPALQRRRVPTKGPSPKDNHPRTKYPDRSRASARTCKLSADGLLGSAPQARHKTSPVRKRRESDSAKRVPLAEPFPRVVNLRSSARKSKDTQNALRKSPGG